MATFWTKTRKPARSNKLPVIVIALMPRPCTATYPPSVIALPWSGTILAVTDVVPSVQPAFVKLAAVWVNKVSNAQHALSAQQAAPMRWMVAMAVQLTLSVPRARFVTLGPSTVVAV